MAKVISGKKIREGDLVTVVDGDVTVTGVVSHIVGYESEVEIFLGVDMSTFFVVPRSKQDFEDYDIVVVRLLEAPKAKKAKKK